MSCSKVLDLSDDALLLIFQFCDIQSLGRLASTCKRFKALIDSRDSVWKFCSRDVFGSNSTEVVMITKSKPNLRFKERCRISKKWQQGRGGHALVLRYPKCMPWIYLDTDNMYVSVRDLVIKCDRADNGEVSRRNVRENVGGREDISKFAATDNEIVFGIRDGTISRWRKPDLHHICSVNAHTSDVLSVDYRGATIVSGSKDGYIKIWNVCAAEIVCKHSLAVNKRILSTLILPSNQHFVVGSPGINKFPPLDLYDLATGKLLDGFGEPFRHGAGIMDTYAESEYTFLSCGYDTTVRLWDIRSQEKSVRAWMDPFDNVIYCVTSDHNRTIVTGACRHGVVHTWDKRSSNYMIYYADSSSPVYSVAFDSSHIFAACEKSVLQVTFN